MPNIVDDTKEVNRTDQEKINKFSRCNQRLTDIDTLIQSRKKIVTDIDDANEIIENLQIVEEDAPGMTHHHYSYHMNHSFMTHCCIQSTFELVNVFSSKIVTVLVI